MQITRKRTNKIEALYTVEGMAHENVDSIKYYITITHYLRWNAHISNMCTNKASRTLGFLRQNLYQCPQDVKKAAYKLDKVPSGTHIPPTRATNTF